MRIMSKSVVGRCENIKDSSHRADILQENISCTCYAMIKEMSEHNEAKIKPGIGPA